MSAAGDLTLKIRNTIPLSESMQFTIERLELEQIRGTAPLAPNINIHGTGFAGSIYSIAVLTGWALCTHIIAELGLDAELVVARAEIVYRAPVNGDLDCRTSIDVAQRDAFLQSFRERGKGRLVLDIAVGDLPQASLHATFVAVARP
jgi:thioesterase domain-containing protein